MQKPKDYAGNTAPVKSGHGQRMECRITTRGGALRLVGTLAEVMGWLRGRCPGGKMAELSRLAEVTQ